MQKTILLFLIFINCTPLYFHYRQTESISGFSQKNTLNKEIGIKLQGRGGIWFESYRREIPVPDSMIFEADYKEREKEEKINGYCKNIGRIHRDLSYKIERVQIVNYDTSHFILNDIVLKDPDCKGCKEFYSMQVEFKKKDFSKIKMKVNKYLFDVDIDNTSDMVRLSSDKKLLYYKVKKQEHILELSRSKIFRKMTRSCSF